MGGFHSGLLVKFFPKAVRQQLSDRFATLRYGYNMTVHEYHASFIQLGSFAPHPIVADETSIAWKFQKWLRPELRVPMASHVR